MVACPNCGFEITESYSWLYTDYLRKDNYSPITNRIEYYKLTCPECGQFSIRRHQYTNQGRNGKFKVIHTFRKNGVGRWQ